jgi:hypothetical protein
MKSSLLWAISKASACNIATVIAASQRKPPSPATLQVIRSSFAAEPPAKSDPHPYLDFTMADASAQPKPSSSVKLVLLGEAAVGKV